MPSRRQRKRAIETRGSQQSPKQARARCSHRLTSNPGWQERRARRNNTKPLHRLSLDQSFYLRVAPPRRPTRSFARVYSSLAGNCAWRDGRQSFEAHARQAEVSAPCSPRAARPTWRSVCVDERGRGQWEIGKITSEGEYNDGRATYPLVCARHVGSVRGSEFGTKGMDELGQSEW